MENDQNGNNKDQNTDKDKNSGDKKETLKRVKMGITTTKAWIIGCALFYKPIWQLTVNERGRYADSEDTFLFKIEDSPDTRLGA